MTLDEAYQKLGLQPIDVRINSGVAGREIGATTWMLVAAAVLILDGKEVVLVGRSLKHGKELAEQCREYVRQLRDARSIFSRSPLRASHQRPNANVFDLGEGGSIYWSSERTVDRFLMQQRTKVEVFQDMAWHQKALRRSKGPYNMIRKLVQVPGDPDTYKAYTEHDEFLLDLTRKGAMEIHQRDSWRIQLIEEDS
jgi:hypothetical protein